MAFPAGAQVLFAQIISFILVMVVFEAYQPSSPHLGVTASLLVTAGAVIWLWLLTRLTVSYGLNRVKGAGGPADPALFTRRLTTYLHALAVLFFVAIITLADLKAQIVSVPIINNSEVLSGLCAVGLYFVLLSVVWSGSHPLEQLVFQQDLGRWDYVKGQVRFVAPVGFPWLLVAICRDALLNLWPSSKTWLNSQTGDLVFLALFLALIALTFPPMVRLWWGCTDWPQGPVRDLSETVLKKAGVKVGGILSWNILEGKMLTAGILGLAPRLRYLLLTPALVKALSPMELAGVVAHEAGHAKLKHVPAFLLLFVGFFVALLGMGEIIALLMDYGFYLLAGSEWGAALLTSKSMQSDLLSVLMVLPMMVLLVVYLRFVMGFFMRHFERQADLYALAMLDDPAPLAQALEKVGLLSGNIREVPSWHHFSIAQRVDALEKAQANPRLSLANQGRLIKKAFKIYALGLALLLGLGWTTGQLELGQDMHRELVIRLLTREAAAHPSDARLRMSLGILNMESGREKQALRSLELAHDLAPHDPEVQNGLAWILVTAKDRELRDPPRALKLALSAVSRTPLPHIWDTLAEAYYANRRPDLALAAAKAAMAAGPKSKLDYYQDQLKRFQKNAQKDD